MRATPTVVAVGVFPVSPLFLIQVLVPLDALWCFKSAGVAAIALTIFGDTTDA